MSYAELTNILKSQIAGVVAFETGIEHIFEPSLLKIFFTRTLDSFSEVLVMGWLYWNNKLVPGNKKESLLLV